MTRRSLLCRMTLPRVLPCLLMFATTLQAQRFYDDDPLEREPTPINVEKAFPRQLSDYYSLAINTFSKPGEAGTSKHPIPAGAVNTLGEVPDSAWYTNRHYKRRMTLEELVRGPGNQNAPATEAPWAVQGAKTEGITPGFLIKDSKGREYLLKFDPLSNPEMATAADIISSKFFYALGYNVPENYVVYFKRSQLVVGKETKFLDRFGKVRKMTERDLSEILLNTPRTFDGRYRAIASFFLVGKWLGPFRSFGTRKDDPNDIVPHENRRDLRGYSVFCAWLDHDDSREINTLDLLVKEDGIQFIKHFLIDFGSTLGSGSTRANSPRSGNEYMFDANASAIQIASLGLFVPRWARAHYPRLPSVGRFEWQVFDPEKWVPEYRNPGFANRLPDDAFWAAKQVMAFSDDEIRAIVKAGQYSNPAAEEWVAKCLMARRDKIGKTFFAKVLPLHRFSVEGNHLVFEDLAVKHKLKPSRNYKVQWSRFDNVTQQQSPLPCVNTLTLPNEVPQAGPGEYFAAEIDGGDAQKSVTVFLRKEMRDIKVVGIDRRW
jgi:hypothetical protein